jgi:DNA methylase
MITRDSTRQTQGLRVGRAHPTHVPAALGAALIDRARVSGAPHDFYRYPARFAPGFAREAIKAFTEPGEVVIDPFCGGGTTVVEAVALGRRVIGADISPLATFLTRAKTTPLSHLDRQEIAAWIDALRRARLNSRISPSSELVASYSRNLPFEVCGFFRWVLDRIPTLPTPRQQSFVRLILLGVGQRAVDSNARCVSRIRLKRDFCRRLSDALTAFSDFIIEAANSNRIPQARLHSLRRIIVRSSDCLHGDGRIPSSWLPAKLVLTSPPYPGVHVVYHRWQINGRKETPTPFWLANQRDGAGESHYTLGPRGQKHLTTYYDRLRSSFSSVALMLDQRATVVQLVAFSDPTWQLPAYLRTMAEAGFRELKDNEKRLWRTVPSRKWYAKSMGNTPASREVLLLHRLV